MFPGLSRMRGPSNNKNSSWKYDITFAYCALFPYVWFFLVVTLGNASQYVQTHSITQHENFRASARCTLCSYGTVGGREEKIESFDGTRHWCESLCTNRHRCLFASTRVIVIATDSSSSSTSTSTFQFNNYAQDASSEYEGENRASYTHTRAHVTWRRHKPHTSQLPSTTIMTYTSTWKIPRRRFVYNMFVEHRVLYVTQRAHLPTLLQGTHLLAYSFCLCPGFWYRILVPHCLPFVPCACGGYHITLFYLSLSVIHEYYKFVIAMFCFIFSRLQEHKLPLKNTWI